MIPHKVLIECRICGGAGQVDLQGIGKIIRVAKIIDISAPRDHQAVCFPDISPPEVKVLCKIDLLKDMEQPWSGRSVLCRQHFFLLQLTWFLLPFCLRDWSQPTSTGSFFSAKCTSWKPFSSPY